MRGYWTKDPEEKYIPQVLHCVKFSKIKSNIWGVVIHTHEIEGDLEVTIARNMMDNDYPIDIETYLLSKTKISYMGHDVDFRESDKYKKFLSELETTTGL